jgi:hypothetical protein
MLYEDGSVYSSACVQLHRVEVEKFCSSQIIISARD